MKNFLFLKILSFFDFIHKKKIIDFLIKQKISTDILVDVGGHHGESISFFAKYLKIKKIYSFEPILNNFIKLKKVADKVSKKYNIFIFAQNSGCGLRDERLIINSIDNESSSSTLKTINFNSKYFKRKNNILNIKNNIRSFEVDLTSLSNFMKNQSIKKIDFLKIDTEGYEYEVLLGLSDRIKDVKCILFEHHYDKMLEKNYNFSNINDYLNKNNFIKVLKLKMYFRKTFEYIYINNINNNQN